MTSYRVTYQIRLRECVGIQQGDWVKKEMIVVAGEDSRETINATLDIVNTGYDFRLKEIRIIGRVDVIAQSLR